MRERDGDAGDSEVMGPEPCSRPRRRPRNTESSMHSVPISTPKPILSLPFTLGEMEGR